jgi:hypothetical protein
MFAGTTQDTWADMRHTARCSLPPPAHGPSGCTRTPCALHPPTVPDAPLLGSGAALSAACTGAARAAPLRAVRRGCVARRRPCRSARSASPEKPGRVSSRAPRPAGSSKGVAWSLRGAATGRVSRQRAGAACAWAGASGMSPVSRCGGRRCRSPRRAPPRDSSGMHQKSLTSEERSPRAKIGR